MARSRQLLIGILGVGIITAVLAVSPAQGPQQGLAVNVVNTPLATSSTEVSLKKPSDSIVLPVLDIFTTAFDCPSGAAYGVLLDEMIEPDGTIVPFSIPPGHTCRCSQGHSGSAAGRYHSRFRPNQAGNNLTGLLNQFLHIDIGVVGRFRGCLDRGRNP